MVAPSFSGTPPTILSRVSRETSPGLIPTDDVAALRTSRTESGYLNVYASRDVWVAKVKEGGRLTAIPGSRCPLPHQSAAYVVAWYKARFGPFWKHAVRNRKRPYWRVSHSSAYGGFVLTVWANGRAVMVREPGTDGRPTDRPQVFNLRSEAVFYAKRVMPRQRRRWAAWAPPRA